MNDYIEKIKSKLVSAVDLDQKKIVRLNDVYESLKTLEAFPMTLAILNSSRIGKMLNDIRHFNEAASEVKNRLKDLIKKWNDKLLPQCNKKPHKSTKSGTNGCNKKIKVSESVNSLPTVDRSVYTDLSKSYRSSNNLEIMNGNTNKYRSDCDQSFEIPSKVAKFDNDVHRLKTSATDPSKSFQKENHFDNKTIPNSIAQTNSLSSVDKSRKRKHESVSNGAIVTPLQKVKSTKELLADMGDLVGNDTKKKILCNEIVLEDDIPRSCLPESVRPRMKPLKSIKNEPGIKIHKSSPKVPNDKLSGYDAPKNIIEDKHQIRIEVKNESKLPHKHIYKDSPTIETVRKYHKPTPVISDDTEIVSLKLKIAVKHKKKSKHIEPPITNRMDELPTLPDIDNIALTFENYETDSNRERVSFNEQTVEKLAHEQWVGYNGTMNPVDGSFVPFVNLYVVNGLYILPWADTVYRSQIFFPSDTSNELTRLSDSVTGYCP